MPACIVECGRKVHFPIHNIIDRDIKFSKHATVGKASATELPEEKNAIPLLSDLVTSASPDGHPLNLLPPMDYLTNEQREEIENICLSYHTVFSRDDMDVGKSVYGPVRLELKPDHKVVRQPPRKYNLQQREALEKHVNNYLERGLIEPSSSSWRSFPVLAPKKLSLIHI